MEVDTAPPAVVDKRPPKDELAALGLCAECIARARREAVAAPRDAAMASAGSAPSEGPLCPICFDALPTLEAQAASLLDALDAYAPASSYHLIVLAPVATRVREAAALQAVSEAVLAASGGDAAATMAKPDFGGVFPVELAVQLRDRLRDVVHARLQERGMSMVESTQSPLKVTVLLEHEETKREPDFLRDRMHKAANSRKRRYGVPETHLHLAPNNTGLGREKVALMLRALDGNALRTQTAVPPRRVATFNTVAMQIRHESIFIQGRYCKLARNVPNAKWIVHGKRRGISSVEEETARYLDEYMRSDGHLFWSAGREDIDVRMLGDGRPFVMEIINPRNLAPTADGLRAVGERTNEHLHDDGDRLVSVNSLAVLPKEGLPKAREAEHAKRKTYRCVVWTSCVLTNELVASLDRTDMVIQQQTPMRVSHRRSLMTRERTVHRMHAERINDHWMLLDMETEAGTYIKEFVHGDFGRTQPNLGSLLVPGATADIVQLDVLSIVI